MAAWLRAMFGFFVLSAMLLVPVHGADATYPGSNGKIAFSPSFYNEVLTIDPDGTHLRRLAFGRHPNWASDGSLIVYTGDINHPDQLLIMNADGSGKRVLLRGAFPSSAAFAPGDAQIVFARNQSPRGGLYTVNTDGSGLVQLTTNGSDVTPDWSPTGEAIAFARDGRIATVQPDGSGMRVLTAGPVDGNPSWSPDGNKIAFDRLDLDNGRTDIWVVNGDGSGQTNITSALSSTFYAQPAWSPDQTLFVARCCYPNIIVLIPVDGSSQTTLTSRFFVDPEWQPVP